MGDTFSDRLFQSRAGPEEIIEFVSDVLKDCF